MKVHIIIMCNRNHLFSHFYFQNTFSDSVLIRPQKLKLKLRVGQFVCVYYTYCRQGGRKCIVLANRMEMKCTVIILFSFA